MLRVPGMGNTSGPRAITQASASCPGLQPLRPAMADRRSTSTRFCACEAERCGGVLLGWWELQVVGFGEWGLGTWS